MIDITWHFLHQQLLKLRRNGSDYYKRRLFRPKCLLMTILGRFYFARVLYKKYKGSNSNLITLSSNTDFGDLSPSVFENIDVSQAIRQLDENGLFYGLQLPSHYLDELLKFANSRICYGDKNYEHGFIISHRRQAEEQFEKKFHLAQYSQLDLSQCSAVHKIANDFKILKIAADYFKSQPIHLMSRLYWLFANNFEEYNYRKSNCYFHYDLDDYCCLRFFFYLTEVNLYNGPHVCVRGSHSKKKLKHIIARSHAKRNDGEIVNYYGFENLATITGPAGVGFIEDSMCFHKATRPLAGDRLMLQVTLAVNDYNFYDSPQVL